MEHNTNEIKRMLKAGHSQEEILDLLVRRHELQGNSVEQHRRIIMHIALMEEDNGYAELFKQ
jgi:DNA-binding CsgD family transcriptional regulator